MMRLEQFVAELRRRRVFRTGGLYLIGAWLVIQVASETVQPLGLPDWSMTFVVWAVIIGFPVALALGWRYELGPSGLVKTAPASGEQLNLSLSTSDYVIVGLVMLVVGIAAFGVVSRSTDTLDQQSLQLSSEELRTVAVLPFASQGSERVDTGLIEGFVDELRDQLNQVPGLRTAGRISSNAFRIGPPDYADIAARLRVQVVVDGSFGRVGDEYCAFIELLEGSTGLVLPSGRYELCDANLAALQRTSAIRIAQALLPDAESVADSVAAGTQVQSAQEARLLADSLYNRVRDNDIVDRESLNRAIDLYREAADLDPMSAIAHARLASALLYRGDIEAAQDSLFNALELNPDLSEVHVTFAEYYSARGSENEGASWRRAVEINQNNPDALENYGLWLWRTNDAAIPEQFYRRAIEIDPLSLGRYARFGEYLGLTGQSAKALELADRVHELFPIARGYRVIARINDVAGRLDEAIAWALKARLLAPDDEDLAAQISELYARIGDWDAARIWEPGPIVGLLLTQRRYAELIDLAEERILDGNRELNVRYYLAHAYNATGQPERALYWLERELPDIHESWPTDSFSVQAVVLLIGALHAVGREIEARNLAARFVDITQNYIETGGHRSWWPYAYQGCALAGVERDEEALDKLEYLPGVPGLVFYPLLVDPICFAHLQDDPRYRAVVASVEARMAGYRERLPATLRAHGLEP